MGNPPDFRHSGYYPKRRDDPQPPRPKPSASPKARESAKPAKKPVPKRKINPFRLGILMLCVGVFCFCAYELAHYFADIVRTRQSTQELSEVYQNGSTDVPDDAQTPAPAPSTPQPEPIATPTAKQATVAPTVTANTQSADALWPVGYPENPRLTISKRFLDLLEKNEDIAGWLTIEGIVDEPVVQRDNEYYLTHNASGQKSVTGALFLDESCDLRGASPQMIVHGHNMKEGAMFGSLKKYKVKSASFYRENPYITFNTLYEEAKYVIFAALSVDVRPGERSYLPFWIYTRFSSAGEFTQYVDRLRALSHYRCGVSVLPGDRLLVLSTCTGDNDNERFLVVARKIRDDEDMLKLRTEILATGDK